MIVIVAEIVPLPPPQPTVKENDGYWLEPKVDPVYVSILGKN